MELRLSFRTQVATAPYNWIIQFKKKESKNWKNVKYFDNILQISSWLVNNGVLKQDGVDEFVDNVFTSLGIDAIEENYSALTLTRKKIPGFVRRMNKNSLKNLKNQ